MTQESEYRTHHAADEYYTPKTLAARWRCSVDIVYDLLRRGELSGFKLGKDWRIPDNARADFEQRKVAKPPAPRIGTGRVLTKVV